MKDRLSILLVDDDRYACSEIISLVDSSDDLILLGVTNNAFKALEYIKDRLPEAIILDLELHQGYGNGFDVLKGLRKLNLEFMPYILVTTNNSSQTTFEAARRLGVDYIMSKNQKDYCEQTALDFLRMMSPVIKSVKRFQNFDSEGDESPAYFEKRITRRVIAELDRIGISPKSIGYTYLIDTIVLTIKNTSQNTSTIVAKKYRKTESSVERAMQNAINRCWATSDIEELNKHYTAKIHSSKGVPTLTEFIFYYVNKIKNDY